MQQPQQAYPTQPAYPQQQAGYPQQQAGYPQQQGYPPPQQGYPAGYAPPQGQVQYVAPTTTVIQTAPAPKQKKIWERYNARVSNVIGWIQIAIAFIIILFFAIGIHIQGDRDGCYKNDAFYVGTGFWAAAFFFISGGFALGAAKHKTTCMIITNMVMSIISTFFGFALLGTAAGIVGVENTPFGIYGYSCYNNSRPNDSYRKTGLAFGAIMIILGLLEVIICIVSSGLSCAAVCCGRTTRQYQAGTVVNTGQTTVMVPQGQPGQAQPMGQYPVGQTYVPPQYNPQYAQGGYPQAAPGPTAPPTYEEASNTKI